MQELSGPVKARISVLKQLQKEHHSLEIELENQVFALERSFDKKFAAFYAQRKAMVDGSAPCKDAVDAGEDASEAGIKGFWLTALMNNSLFKSVIQEQDMEVLEHIIDVRVVYPSPNSRSFQIEFVFSPAAQEFFEEKVLIKKVIYEEDPSDPGVFSLKGTEGTPIHWKSGKNCTVQLVSKMQRHKTKNITRTVEREEGCPSFFNFFEEIKAPESLEETEAAQEAVEEYEAMLEMDYEMAQTLKERIVPNAVDYFLGLAMDDEEEADGCDSCGEDHDDDEDDYEDVDEDEEEDDDEEEAEEIPRTHRGPKGQAGGAAKPECQQQ